MNVINQFKLEGGKEAFSHRVVPAITAPAHAAAQPILSEHPLIVPARVLANTVRMMN